MNNQLDTLIANLVSDLIELENTDTNDQVIAVITKTYEKIYSELIEIRKENG